MISRTRVADLRRSEGANRRGLRLQRTSQFLDQRSSELEIARHALHPADRLGRVVIAVRLSASNQTSIREGFVMRKKYSHRYRRLWASGSPVLLGGGAAMITALGTVTIAYFTHQSEGTTAVSLNPPVFWGLLVGA